MAVTVIVQQVTPADDNSALRIKGTVGGVAYTTALRNYRFDPVALNNASLQNTLGAWLLARFNAIVVSMTSGTLGLNSRTVNLIVQDSRKSVIVYGAAPYTYLDYDNLEITGTVDGVSTKIQISQDNYIEQALGSTPSAYAPGQPYGVAALSTQDMGVYIGQLLYAQAQRVAQQYTPFINTFSI